MPKTSAGILPYRFRSHRLQVLLVHPGGPFWVGKDFGSWSIAKGEFEADEDAFAAALREFEEETGCRPTGPFLRLTQLRQPSGKLIDAWATGMEWDPAQLVSNTFSLEWPQGSGRMQEFPEVDRAAWFEVEEAMRRILPGQRGFIAELVARLAADAE